MTRDKITSLIALAKANHAEAEAIAKAKRDKAAAELYATLGDKAKPYVDTLFEKIEQGSSMGIVEYIIDNLPQDDFYHKLDYLNSDMGVVSSVNLKNCPAHYVMSDTVSSRLMGILKGYNIKCELEINENNIYVIRAIL